MSKKPKGLNIPWVVIILSFVFGVWPLGVALTLLRVLPLNGSSSSATVSSQTRTTSAETANEQVKQQTASANRNIYSAGRTSYPHAEAAQQPAAAAGKKPSREKKSSAPKVLKIVSIALLSVALLVGMASVSELFDGGGLSGMLEALLAAMYFFVGGGITWAASGILNRRERDTIRYAAMIGDSESYSLTKLSSATSYKISKVRRDLQRMIDDGMFGDQAYIDMTNLCFMRTPDAKPDGVAQQFGDGAYHRSMSGVAADLGADTASVTQEAPPADSSADETDMTDFDAILRKIRRLDDEILDEPVSERIRKIESITRHIFEYVEDKPDKMPQIRMFMNYYLPTTLKLLESYSRIERVGVAGQNMREAKENIEKILDMLTAGFQQQFDQLYKAESLDISSDIEVLEKMMSKDGLCENTDFVLREETSETFGNEYSDDLSDDVETGGAAVQEAPESRK